MSGRRTAFPDVHYATDHGSASERGTHPLGGSAGFWSPDGDKLLVGGRWSDPRLMSWFVLDLRDRSVEAATLGEGVVAGWTSDDSVAVVYAMGRKRNLNSSRVRTVEVREVTVDGRLRRTVRLRLGLPWGGPGTRD